MTTASDQKTDATIGAWLAVPVAIALAITVRGAVLAKLWAWFVVPIFAVGHLGWVDAAGLSVATQVLVAAPSAPQEAPITGRLALTQAVTRSLVTLSALGVGAVLAVAR